MRAIIRLFLFFLLTAAGWQVSASSKVYTYDVANASSFDSVVEFKTKKVTYDASLNFLKHAGHQQSTPNNKKPQIGAFFAYTGWVVVPKGGGFDVASTFRNGRFREITLKKGPVLERAFENGVTNPIGGFTTRGVTAQKLTSGGRASDILALGGTSNAVPTNISKVLVTRETTAKIGFIAGSTERSAIQVVVDNAPASLVEISRRSIGR